MVSSIQDFLDKPAESETDELQKEVIEKVAEAFPDETAEALENSKQSPLEAITETIKEIEDKTPYAEKLRDETAAVRFGVSKMGVRKSLKGTQKEQAAATFGANEKFVTSAKKLVNTKNIAWRNVHRLITEAKAYWQANTTPYPERGIRLISKVLVDSFVTKMESHAAKISDATAI